MAIRSNTRNLRSPKRKQPESEDPERGAKRLKLRDGAGGQRGPNQQLLQENSAGRNAQRWGQFGAFIRRLENSRIFTLRNGILDVLRDESAWTSLTAEQQATLTGLFGNLPDRPGVQVSGPHGHALYNPAFATDCRLVGHNVQAGRYRPAVLSQYARDRDVRVSEAFQRYERMIRQRDYGYFPRPEEEEEEPEEPAPKRTKLTPESKEKSPKDKTPKSKEKAPKVMTTKTTTPKVVTPKKTTPKEKTPESTEETPKEKTPGSLEKIPKEKTPQSKERTPKEKTPTSKEKTPKDKTPTSKDKAPAVHEPAAKPAPAPEGLFAGEYEAWVWYRWVPEEEANEGWTELEERGGEEVEAAA